MLFRLREILINKNMPFSAFAERMNVTPSSLAVTERFYPSIATVQRCAEELGMPTWEMVYDCGVELTTPYVRPADEPSVEDKVDQRLQTLLKERHYTMRKLALAMGITQQSLGQTIKKRKLSLKTVENMAAGLCVEPWELLATPEEVRAEVLRRKHELGIEDEPEPTDESHVDTATDGAYVVLPTLANGLVDLSAVVMIDIPEGKVAALPMSAVRIIERNDEQPEPETDDDGEELVLTTDHFVLK